MNNSDKNGLKLNNKLSDRNIKIKDLKSDDIQFMSMIYKILNSIIIALETGRFVNIKPNDLEI